MSRINLLIGTRLTFAVTCVPSLDSADKSPWKDRLFNRINSQSATWAWIDTKHKLLYYARLFATGMKNARKSRVYLNCFPGQPLPHSQNWERRLRLAAEGYRHEFTKFIFTEMSVAAAEVSRSTAGFLKIRKPVNEIWCGDCADAISPNSSRFIDRPLINGNWARAVLAVETLHSKRCDHLINIQHGMGIKTNIHHTRLMPTE
jgi:hypothetical protein